MHAKDSEDSLSDSGGLRERETMKGGEKGKAVAENTVSHTLVHTFFA
jgi:hypothetical protein